MAKNKNKRAYQPPPDTVIDLAMAADIDGVQKWVRENPGHINDVMKNGGGTFEGTLLHAGFCACMKLQPIIGPIKSVMLIDWLLQQPDINPITKDPIGHTPRRAQSNIKSISLVDDRLETFKDKKYFSETIKAAVKQENKERVQYGGKVMSERQEKVFITKTIAGERAFNSFFAGMLLTLSLMCPVAVVARLCVMYKLAKSEQKYTQKINPQSNPRGLEQ